MAVLRRIRPMSIFLGSGLFVRGRKRKIYKQGKIGLTMENIDITRMSSKGQIVIPKDMRAGFKKGEKILIIKDKGRLILKKASSMSENLKEDLEFARRTEEAYKRIEAGEYIEIDSENLVEEMMKW